MVARKGTLCKRPGTGAARFVRAVSAAYCLGVAVAGCSFRLPMSPSAVSSEDVTGSIAVSPLESWLDLEDRRPAMSALATALDPQGAGAPAGWNNPITKNKGVFAAQGKPYPVDDQVCRLFSAVISKDNNNQRLTGTACLQKSGDWVIAEIKPEKKSAAL